MSEEISAIEKELTQKCKHKVNKQDVQKDKDMLKLLQGINDSFKQQIHELQSDIKLNEKEEYQNLKSERRALLKLFPMKDKLSLKQNFHILICQKMEQKNQLQAKLDRIKMKNQQLLTQSLNLEIKIDEGLFSEKEIITQKSELERVQRQIEKQKQKKTQFTNHNVSTINEINKKLTYDLNEFEPIEHSVESSQSNSFLSRNPQEQKSFSQSQFSQRHQSYQNELSIIENQDLFQCQAKSKQILKSLERQLNPLKLDDILKNLQNQINHIKNTQIHKLKLEKSKNLLKSKQLKQNLNSTNRKIQKMKTHVKKFKLQKFGSNFN